MWVWVGAELSLDVTQLEKLWHKGPDFVKGGTPIPLIFRVATVSLHRFPLQPHMAALFLMGYTADTTLCRPPSLPLPPWQPRCALTWIALNLKSLYTLADFESAV